MHFKRLLAVSGLVLFAVAPASGGGRGIDDYWSSTFDSEANCKQEKLVTKLINSGSGQCATFSSQDDYTAFLNCRQNLNKLLVKKCDPKVDKAGELLYCKKRGIINCCFHNFTCVGNWSTISKSYAEHAVNFLSNPTESMKKEKAMGYKSCHKIEGYDASVCAKDCEKAEESQFAKNCTESGGFFKCCVRRDKKNCDECRFCCSLPICSYKKNGVVLHSTDQLYETQDQKYEQSAIDKFALLETMYKRPDYRCLKPMKNKEPDKWPYYHHEDFQNAQSKEDLEKASVIEFDKYFMNFDDPHVFQQLVVDANEKLWKKTFGYDYARKLAKNYFFYNKKEDKVEYSFVPGFKHCLKDEMSEFGRRCKKSGGYFKCCVVGLDLQPFHNTIHILADKKLVKRPPKNVCKADPKQFHDECTMVLATSMCSKMNITSGQVETRFKVPVEPKFTFGGVYSEKDPAMRGLRTMYCNQFLPCQGGQISFSTEFGQVYDRKSHCEGILEAQKVTEKKEGKTLYPNLEKFIEKTCSKQKFDSVFMCKDSSFPDARKDYEKDMAHQYSSSIRKAVKEGKGKHRKTHRGKRRKSKKFKKRKNHNSRKRHRKGKKKKTEKLDEK